MKRYYEALNKNHEIVRFWAESETDVLNIAKSFHYKGVIQVSYRSLQYRKTVLPYKSEGY